MKGIVIYDTSYGNTKAVAEAISGTLKGSGIEVDTLYVKDIKKLRGQDYDFMILGSPTKFGTMSFTVKGFLGKVKKEEWLNKPFAAFDTENPENIEKQQGSAAEKIAQKLKEKQMKQMGPGSQSCGPWMERADAGRRNFPGQRIRQSIGYRFK